MACRRRRAVAGEPSPALVIVGVAWRTAHYAVAGGRGSSDDLLERQWQVPAAADPVQRNPATEPVS